MPKFGKVHVYYMTLCILLYSGGLWPTQNMNADKVWWIFMGKGILWAILKKNMERKAILRKPPIFKYNKRQINGDHTGPLVINDTNKTLQKTNFICSSG